MTGSSTVLIQKFASNPRLRRSLEFNWYSCSLFKEDPAPPEFATLSDREDCEGTFYTCKY